VRNAPSAKKGDSILRQNLKKLSDGGVTIATGTDAGNIGTQHVSSYYDELAVMQQSGMNTWACCRHPLSMALRAVAKEALFGAC
jgi:hypothetical protein